LHPFVHGLFGNTPTFCSTGAILAPGKRTVASVLRLMGQADEPHFPTYHRVLNRASWASLKASRFLLRFLLAIFIP
jgi:hypothetical protein